MITLLVAFPHDPASLFAMGLTAGIAALLVMTGRGKKGGGNDDQ